MQDIEAVLKHWAATFEIPETELHNRIMAAADGKLAKPPVNVSSRRQAISALLQQLTLPKAAVSSISAAVKPTQSCACWLDSVLISQLAIAFSVACSCCQRFAATFVPCSRLL
jgi:hypothetical protein